MASHWVGQSSLSLLLLLLAAALLALPHACLADIYLHSPRGSNDKLNENNDNGGYQVGDNCKPNCLNPDNTYNVSKPGAGQGIMYFYSGSVLYLGWTMQHACGQQNIDGPLKTRCEASTEQLRELDTYLYIEIYAYVVILQYMCDSSPPSSALLRDGQSTNTVPNDATQSLNATYGMHESQGHYADCLARERNKGLFTADRGMNNGVGATATRQNNNGNRYGLECPEERDYYPYWHPSPWRDIAVLTSDPSRCSYYRANSENVLGRGYCTQAPYNNPAACQAASVTGAQWVTGPAHGIAPPDCSAAPFSRDNHLGNGAGPGHDSPSYNWTVPLPPFNLQESVCVLRIRYNITTGDYQTWTAGKLSTAGVLNSASAYFDAGLLPLRSPGSFAYSSTRNNNFSNRSQKGFLVITPASRAAAIAGGATGGVAGVAAAAAGVWFGAGIRKRRRREREAAARGVRETGEGGGTTKFEQALQEQQGPSKSPFTKFLFWRAPTVIPVTGANPSTPSSASALVATTTTTTTTPSPSTSPPGSPSPTTTPSASFLSKWWNRLPKGRRFLLLYAAFNAALFWDGWLFAVNNLKVWPYGPYYPFAKAGGYMLDFNCNLVLFPVMRNLLSWIRTTPVAEAIPLDDHLLFHQIVAGSGNGVDLLFATREGITGHLIILFFLIMFATAHTRVRRGKGVDLGWFKIGGYDLFFAVHRYLYIGVFLLLWIHSRNFHHWSFFPVLVWFLDKLVGRMRAGREVRLLRVVDEVTGTDVMRLEMRLKGFRYKSGQYLYLNCPHISKHEWHPFTITSAPEEPLVSVHIRTRGDWTTGLRQLLNPDGARSVRYADPSFHKHTLHGDVCPQASPLPLRSQAKISKDKDEKGKGSGKAKDKVKDKDNDASSTIRAAEIPQISRLAPELRVDGPYGAGSEHVVDYSTVVLVGAGIGVTPFASVLKSCRLRWSRQLGSGVGGGAGEGGSQPSGRPDSAGERNDTALYATLLRPLKVYFYWVCKDKQEFNWFSWLLAEFEEDERLSSRFEINTYMTGELSLDDDATKETDKARWAGKRWAGRPNWRRIFKQISGNHPQETIGVFLCGPGDFLHVQWTGSDANSQGNDGEGKTGTDRSNLVQIAAPDATFPLPASANTMMRGTDGRPDTDVVLMLALLRQSGCNYTNPDTQSPTNCKVLNSASAYFDAGLLPLRSPGSFAYSSTRNNNFSNRSQKGFLVITPASRAAAIAGGATGGVAGVAAAAAGVWFGAGIRKRRRREREAAARGVRETGEGGGTTKFEQALQEQQGPSKSPFTKFLFWRAPTVIPVTGANPSTPSSASALVATTTTTTTTPSPSTSPPGSPSPTTTPSASFLSKWWNRLPKGRRFLLLYAAFNAALFWDGWLFAVNNLKVWPYGPYYPFAKAGGYMLDFNCNLVLFPVMRNLLSWIRTTPVAEAIPLDDHLLFHQIVAGSGNGVDLLFATREGITGHLIILFFLIMFATAHTRVRRGKGVDLGWFKIGGYDLFFAVHRYLYIGVFLLLWIHSRNFHHWSFFPVLVWFLDKLVGRMRAGREVRLLRVVDEVTGTDVMRLEMRLKGFRYKSGQYLYLNCPHISKHEWHPFTITSAPEEPLVSVHIRTRGDWTTGLRQLLNPDGARSVRYADPSFHKHTLHGDVCPQASPLPLRSQAKISKDKDEKGKGSGKAKDKVKDKDNDASSTIRAAEIPQISRLAPELRVDGPYGAGSEHVVDYSTVVLVGAGIGVTPFASVLKSCRLRWSRQLGSGVGGGAGEGGSQPSGRPDSAGERNDTALYATLLRPLKVYFYWVCKDKQEFNWFSWLLAEFEEDERLSSRFEINTYMTGELSLDDDATKETDKARWAGKRWAGRPNWRRIFKQISGNHPQETIGVFLCGPGDFLHVQWTGSDANSQGNDGEGKTGTDRSNLVQIAAPDATFPLPASANTMMRGTDGRPDTDVVLMLALLRQSGCNYTNPDTQSPTNCKVLNSASAYFDAGLLPLRSPGSFAYSSTRNNNFSNRSQKGFLVITPASRAAAIAGGATGGVAGVAAAAAGVWFGAGIRKRRRREREAAARGVRETGEGGGTTKFEQALQEQQGPSKSPFTKFLFWRAPTVIPVTGANPSTPSSASALVATTTTTTTTPSPSTSPPGSPSPTTTPSASFLSKWWNRLPKGRRFLLLYAAFNAALFWDGWLFAVNNLKVWPYGPYYPFAKAGGYMLDFNCNLVLFPVMRNLLSWIRTTPVAEAIPLDDHLLFHQIVAGSGNGVDLLFATREGITGHLIILFFLIMFATAHTRVRRGKGVDLGWFKIGGYDLFFAVHRYLYIGVFLLLWIHSRNFHHWSFFPVLVWFLDKLVGRMRAGREVRLLRVVDEVTGTDVMRLEMRLKGFRYKSGQYLYLNCPHISKHEWHPFTITSAPEEPLVSVHIRTRGDWTTGLRQLLNPDGARSVRYADPSFHKHTLHGDVCPQASPLPLRSQAKISKDKDEKGKGSGKAKDKVKDKDNDASSTIRAAEIPQISRLAPELRVDGPYGAGSEHVVDYSTVVLVGAGIGVTPFASVLKSCRLRWSRQLGSGVGGGAGEGGSQPSGRPDSAGERNDTALYATLLRPLKVYFYWVCKDKQEFNWFSWLLAEFEEDERLSSRFEINTYMTGELSLDDDATKETDKARWAGKRWAGRPNWRRIFKQISGNHPQETIGVFLCGPGADELSAMCKQFTSPGNNTFEFHKENF
eukprot:jgi/Chlat1/5571/Chrsp369S00848